VKNHKAEIRRCVQTLLAGKHKPSDIADDAPLLTSGLLDSIDVLEIVSFLESHCGIDFAAQPFDPSAFDSIDSIASLAQGR
jgi:acyl carrier protein